MKTFTIDVDDNITAFGDGELSEEIPAGAERFCSERELASLAAEWPASRLVAVWDSLPGVQPVKRFTNRKTAIARIWNAIQSLEPTVAQHARTTGSKLRGSSSQASRQEKPDTGRKNTRAAQVIELLQQPGGASLKEIMTATRWQAHSVRGFISGHLRKKLGLQVKSFKRNGERVYALRKRTKSD
jgi:hypothetical protein